MLNEQHEAIRVYGNVNQFVRRLPPGRISVDVKDMVNEDIKIAVASAIHRAKETGEEVLYTDIHTQSDDVSVSLSIRVYYVKEHDIENVPGFFWLIFEENNSEKSPSSVVNAVSFDASEQARQRIEELDLELKRNKEHLQVTVEELETTNEEMQSANEELMSANEELQSTNEELQSVNEELYTVNSEYQEKLAEISQANNDLDEVLGLSQIGIIFPDEHLLIRRYTQAVTRYINLMDSDVHRPLHHISSNINYDGLIEDVSEVFSQGKAREHELVLDDKRVLRVSINPYNYADISQSKGAVSYTHLTLPTTPYV